MRAMEDSVDPDAIDPSVQLVGGYVDGEFGPAHATFDQPGWDAASWDRFPNAVHVRIATHPDTADGNVGDVENGDMSPSSAVGWVHRRRAAGANPSVYCNRATIDAVRAAFDGAHEPMPPIWLATLDGTVSWLPGVVAVQYLGAAALGRNVDRSMVLDYWPGIDPDPVVPPVLLVEDDGVPRH